MSKTGKKLTQHHQSVNDRRGLTELYDKLHISEFKFKDLRNLISASEKKHHVFQDNLSYKPEKKSNNKNLASGNAAKHQQEKPEKKLEIKEVI